MGTLTLLRRTKKSAGTYVPRATRKLMERAAVLCGEQPSWDDAKRSASLFITLFREANPRFDRHRFLARVLEVHRGTWSVS